MKRKISLFIFLLVTVFVLSGCAMQDEASYEKYGDEYNEVDTEAQAPEPVVEDAELDGADVIQSAVIPALENRKIIYTANLTMQTPTPSDVYNNVIENLDTYSAYIESASINSTRYIVKIRVLSENFTDFVEEIKTTGDVISFSKTSDDVTNTYSTFESRKLALETQHARILELIEVAVDLDDILTLDDARFEIETELNEIGASLANFDSLVDFSTINLTINKTSEQVVILPKTANPTVNVLEVTKNTMELEVYNSSEQPVIIYVDLLQNGEFIRQYEQEAYGESSIVFEIDDLKSFKEYTFKVTTIEADHRESNIVSREATTDKTFFNRVTNSFVTSFNSLVRIAEFLGLTIVALSPYAVVGAVLFFPIRYLSRKVKSKYSLKFEDIKEKILPDDTKYL